MKSGLLTDNAEEKKSGEFSSILVPERAPICTDVARLGAGDGQAAGAACVRREEILVLRLRELLVVFVPFHVIVTAGRLQVTAQSQRGSYSHCHRARHCRSTSFVFVQLV